MIFGKLKFVYEKLTEINDKHYFAEKTKVEKTFCTRNRIIPTILSNVSPL